MIQLKSLFLETFNPRSIASKQRFRRPIQTIPSTRNQVTDSEDILKTRQTVQRRLTPAPGPSSEDLGFKPVRSYINPTYLP
ncbi:MAG: hypothetical protein PHD05_00655 [Sphaerochaetaceae bacterium]|jgi:hypothetical protein|nr:hypothetical protein [Sphaerochaetaceae bacterium]